MKRFLVIAMSSVLVFAACSKKDVKDGDKDRTVVAYDATGSDAGKAGDMKSVHFDFDQSNIIGGAKDILNSSASWLKKNPKVNVQIEGHCDSRGSIEYNMALGEKRAITVKKYLTALGIKSARLHTISYGEERPLDGRQTESAWAKNRRANFVLVK
ncbi:MAG: peptidoglycan-associated lipoprotein Pal [Pseudomonadota bacterium]